jgi:phosphatidylinositol 3-kinase
MVWRFRYSLMENEKALNKFLRCVRWNSQEEAAEAAKLMYSWKTISIADALELLCPYFENVTVREYAVKILSEATDNDLQLYLLQLVQAIKFEIAYPSSLSEFLISRCTRSFELANFLFWHVTVEMSDERYGSRFANVMRDFLGTLDLVEPDHKWSRMLTEREKYLVRKLVDLSNGLKGKKVEKMKEHMRQLLDTEMKELCFLDPGICYPLAPAIVLEGLLPEQCSVFKSAKAPLRLTFKAKNARGENSTSLAIFKAGDDLRQDQLVIQLINLMDLQLKNHGLDLKLSPYRVMATGPDDGFLELVDRSQNMSTILKNYNNRIDNFLMSQSSKPNQQQEILQNYVRSCAGYCVITYILGIGDRHLDNILIRETGHFFHIDFGFIFGRDPKPLPPKVRITKEMIDAMDGMNSPHYKQFISYCFQAYSILRKNANLFLNLLSLMCASGIPDLTNDFDNTMSKVQEKFRLDLLEEEEANLHIYQVIHESLNSLTPQVMDRFHEFAMVFK